MIGLDRAHRIALGGGAVSGLSVVSMSPLGVGGLFYGFGGIHGREHVPLQIVGLGFGASFLDLPIGELHNRKLGLNDLWGAPQASCTSACGRRRAWEPGWLRSARSWPGRGSRHRHLAVAFALAELAAVPTRALSPRCSGRWACRTAASPSASATRSGWSRVPRFQAVVRAADGVSQVDWADVALAGGYYDQAHLIADFREFAGVTPGRYLTRRGHRENHVPLPG